MSNTQYTDVQSKKLENAEYEITATIPAEVMTQYRSKAIKQLGANVEVPGFRKGNVPEDMLIGHLGESRVMEKAANMALADVYPKIVVDEKIDAIGSPQIQITKLANGNPLEFTAKTAVMPTVELPDYQKIAKDAFSEKTEKFDVTDEEVNETLTHIRRQRAQIEQYEKQKAEGAEQPQLPEVKDEDLPELTDDFVKQLGDFETVAEFEAKVRDNISEEKKLRDREKKRIKAVENIIEKSKIQLPQILVDQELSRIQMQMESDVAQAGIKADDYLTKIGKSMEDLRKEWLPEAEKRAKLQLILNKIAAEQNITLDEEAVEKEVQHVLAHYPQAEKENVRVYVETTKRNEATFQWLENAGN